jgi:iron complex outermembrane recepter protein
MRNVKHKVKFLAYSVLMATMDSQLSVAQEKSENAVEEVVIVGSRIARSSDFDGPTPVQTIDRNEIEHSGYHNLHQLLEKIPSVGNGTFSSRGNNQDSSANGASAISLRGMGADATLVLVNGRRVAISSFAENITTGFVDINSIPMSAIERVEVLKDGASAVYGSDAIAGVVNFVLRNDFEGFDVTAGYGNTTDTDSDEQTVSAIWGMNGDHNANFTVIFDYFSNSSLMNKDRGSMGTANQLPFGGMDLRSSRSAPGSFQIGDEFFVDPTCPADRLGGSACKYDYAPWALLIPEAERTGVLMLGHRDLFDNVEVFTEIGVQHNTSIAQGAPTPLDGGAGLTVPITHPNNPFPDAESILIDRLRTIDAGPRQWNIETDNLRMLLGLRGRLFNDWKWETSFHRARSESTQTGNKSQGWVRTDFLQEEIDAGRYNPFGGVINPQSVIDAITTNVVRIGESEQTAFEGSMNGEIFEMAGGAAAMAFGVEYREEEASDVPDDQFQRGLIYGTESVSASAKRDITSAFVEMFLPLLDGVDITLAARYDEYSDFGSTTNPMFNIRWAPFDFVALRASWGTGFRAPSLAQVGLGPSQESVFFEDTHGCAVNPAYCVTTDYVIVFSGNPDLEPEESESFNTGVIFDFSESLRISVDYWEIVQENKIDRLSFGNLFEQFCNVQDSEVCVRKAPAGDDALGGLLSVNNSYVNIGEQSVKGIDLGMNFSTDLAGGELGLRFDYSYLLEFERVEPDPEKPGTISRDLAGEYEYPEHRWTASADWQFDQWGFNANLRYVGEFEDTPDIDFDGILDYQNNTSEAVDAFVTLNLQARFSGIANTVLTVGLDNALDEEPPFAAGDNDSDVYGFVLSQHSPRGRFLYTQISYSF